MRKEQPLSGRTRLTPIRLGWQQFAVLAAGILLVFAVIWLMLPWRWEQAYVYQVLIPRIQARYGFECGDVDVRGASFAAITKVMPGGRLAGLGVRPGDRPGEPGRGWVEMYDALVAAERGRFGKFDVVNASDFPTFSRGWRTIVANPPNTEPAVDNFRGLFGRSKNELTDPTGRRSLQSVEPEQTDAPVQLWVRDVATGVRTKVYSYGVNVSVVWSTDGRWLAVTDYDYTATSSIARCMVLDTEAGGSEDLAKVIARYDAATGRHMGGNKDVQCRVFGWVRGTSRVALTVTGYRRADPFGFRQDFFYDVATRRLLAVP